MNETHIGLLVLGVPALLIGGLILQRWRPVLWFYVAALGVGLWYLTGTGTVQEVGRQALGYIPTSAPAEAPPAPAAEPAAAAPEAAPAAETPAPAPPEEAPAMAPAPEAAPEPAPAPDAAPAPEEKSSEPAPASP